MGNERYAKQILKYTSRGRRDFWRDL